MDAYERAVKLLSIREHSRVELRKKLVEKGYSEIDSDEALDKLISLGYLSDYRFAQSYIRSRMRKSPEGKGILLLRLREKGCDIESASNALEEMWSENIWKEPLSKALGKQMLKHGEEYSVMYFRKKGFSSYEIEEAKGDLNDSKQ